MTADSQQAEREAAVDDARKALDASLLIPELFTTFNDDQRYNNEAHGLRDAFEAAARAAGRAEAEELEALFALQHTRTVEADKLWREAHPGNDLTAPDLGVLLTWLLERTEALEGALQAFVSWVDAEPGVGLDAVTGRARALLPSEGADG